MPYKHGKGYWGWMPLRSGGRKRVGLGTTDKPTARVVETLLRQLAGRREWDLLEAIESGRSTAGEVYDYARLGGDGLGRLRARLNDVDLIAHIPGWLLWAQRRASASTVAKYERQLRHLLGDGAPFLRSEFTRKRLNQELAKLPLSGSTARRYHAAWSSFAKYLVEIEVIETNPLRSITAPRNNPARELYLTFEDSQRLVLAQPEPYRSIAALREGAGVEISAALTVRMRDVDVVNQTIRVRGTKNRWRDRPVFVEDWAWEVLLPCFRAKLPDALLFVEPDGSPVTYRAAYLAHRQAVQALGLPEGYGMHDSRHSFAVRCMKAGIDPQMIANNLGHRDATMVLRVYGKYRVTAKDFRRVRTGTEGS